MSVLRTLTALLFLLILLAGCSGGNGNDSGGNSGGSIVLPSSTYAAGSVEKAQFDRLNQIRLAGGFGEVQQDSKLDQSVASHAGYIVANGYADIYKEVGTASGFTGIDATARYAAQGGVANWVNEYINYSDSQCIDDLSNDIFYRALLLTSVQRVGIKTAYDLSAKHSICVLDFVVSNNQVNNDPSWVGVYPGMGQTGVQLAMPTSAADPAPSIATGQKGSPVSMYFGGALGRVDFFLLKEAKSGAVIPTVKIGKADFPSSLTDKEIHLIPTQLLATDTTYTASFSGVLVDGTVVTKEWSFSTVVSNIKTSVSAPSYAAGSVEKSLFDRLNQVRQAGGFGMVPQDGLLDQSAKNHAAYALANDYDSVAAAWRWATISFGTEVSGTPGFTGVDSSARYVAVGGGASQVSELTGYNKDLMCVDDQLNSVFQRHRILATDLSGIGIGFSYASNKKDSACFIDYINSSAVIAPSTLMAVYPTPGQTSLAMSMAADAPDPAPSIPNAQKGLPVSIFLGRTLAQVTSFTLRETATSTVVPVVLVTQKDFPSSLSDREAHIVPTQLLATDATYTASFSGVLVDGTVVTKEWSFSTVASNLKTSVPAPSYVVGSIERIQFDRLNQIRLAGGFGVVPQDTLIDQASLNHADYLLAHYYNPLQSPAWSPSTGLVDPSTGWLNGHVEVVGLSGFSGILPQARLAYVGRQSEWAGEVVAFQENCVDGLLNTVFHRDGLLDATITGLGIGLRRASNNQDLACVVEYSTSSSMIRPTGWVGLYPMPGQTGVPLGMGGESPDPAPSVPDAQKGSPVTIYLNTPLASVTSFTLRDAATSAMVPVLLLTKKEFPMVISDSVAHILPTQLLTTGTTYTASFSGVLADGSVVNKVWSFTTEPIVPINIALSPAAFSSAGSTIQVSASGGNGNLSFFVSSFYSYYGGVDPGANFSTNAYLNPHTMVLTRNSTACTPGVLVNCSVDVTVTDSMGNTKMVSIPVN